MSAVALLALGIGLFATVGGSSSSADVTAVDGSAYGYFASVSLFGGPAMTRGPDPEVTLPPAGSAVPITDTATTGSAVFGPASIFTSGPITVSTEGTTGPTGSVTSTAEITNINTSQQEVLTATALSSTCTGAETGTTGSTAVTGGTLVTSEGDPDVEGDETIVTIPTDPAPNTSYDGVIESIGDSFRYVFNEQVVTGNSITVNAAHMYLIGPTAVGDLILGQVVCGVTVTPGTTTTTQPTGTTTTTQPTGTTTTTQPTGTTTTTQPTGTTTTTQPTGTTTTTQPTGTTTTTQPTGTTTTTQPTGTTTTTQPTGTTTTTQPTGTTTTTTTPVTPGIDCTTVAPRGTTPTATVDPNSAVAGSNANVAGDGFIPNELLDVGLCSSPVHLASVTADASGGFRATVTIPAGTSAGAHTIVVSSADGSRVALASITVVAQGSGGTTGGGTVRGRGLARTGAENARMAGLAALALMLGAVLVRSARKTRRWPYRSKW